MSLALTFLAWESNFGRKNPSQYKDKNHQKNPNYNQQK